MKVYVILDCVEFTCLMDVFRGHSHITFDFHLHFFTFSESKTFDVMSLSVENFKFNAKMLFI